MLGSSAGLIIAALIGIAVIVCLIVFAKVHAFLALMLGSFVMAILAGVPLTDSFTSFTTGWAAQLATWASLSFWVR